MATIDSTVGTTTANSYCSMAEATDYFTIRYDTGSAWTSATGAQQSGSIRAACDAMEGLSWVGIPTTNTQSLSFPRIGAPKRTLGWGVWEDSNSIPQRVKDAQCEWAAAILAGTFLLNPDPQNIGPTKVGTIEVQVQSGYHEIPPQCASLLKGLYVVTNSGLNATVTR